MLVYRVPVQILSAVGSSAGLGNALTCRERGDGITDTIVEETQISFPINRPLDVLSRRYNVTPPPQPTPPYPTLSEEDKSLRDNRLWIKRLSLLLCREEPLVRHKQILDRCVFAKWCRLELHQRREEARGDALSGCLEVFERDPVDVFGFHPGRVKGGSWQAEVDAVVFGTEEQGLLQLACVLEPAARVVFGVQARCGGAA
jgi:hypothetical protein